MKKKLDTVTLLGVDCVNIERLILAADICCKDFEFASVKLLTSLPSEDPRIVKIDPIESVEAYSKFCIADLDKYVDTAHVLIIQHDGFILNPNAWDDKFLSYDYIGSPWLVDQSSVDSFDFPKELIGTKVVGNGGFSLRSKWFTVLCSQLSESGIFETYHPEDIVLSVKNRIDLEVRGAEFAPVELAEKFSFEAKNDADDKWNDQFGFHGLRWSDISKWLDAHPEYKDRIINELDKDKNK